jgi:uncharacterized integral membrane protein (TIGR00698 family)
MFADNDPGVAAAASGTARLRLHRRGVEIAGSVVPGVLLAAIVGLTAHLAAQVAFPYGLAVGFEVPMAMLLGLVLVNVAGPADWATRGIRFSVKYILGLGIVLLGLRIDLQTVSEVGSKALWLILVTISVGCGFALWMGRRLGVRSRVAMLIGAGSTICGNSAILATAPVIGADEREVSFAVATITLVGTLGVFLFPLVGHALGLDVLTYGVWTGASVPDTAQTIASSAAYSTVARDVAVIVKLVRTAMLAPLLISLLWGWARYSRAAVGERESSRLPAASARRGVRKAFPFFLVGFVLLALARTERVIDPEKVMNVDVVTRACFVTALAALGLQTRLEHLRAFGPRSFLLAVGTTVLLAAGSLPVIAAFGIGPARTVARGAVDPRPLGQWCLSPGPAVAYRGCRPAAPVADVRSFRLTGLILATGIPGAGALSPVGAFHPSSPINANLSFAARTQPGEVLDPHRLLVASTSNFGAPTARAGWAPGTILSLTTDVSAPLVVPPRFAVGGGQASALDGRVQVYTAQSPSFRNRLSTPGAVTASMPAVSKPLGISINDAFGRPWFASSPTPADSHFGIESLTDPGGRPLADAPSQTAGGVFAGTLTDRRPQLEVGALRAGAVANALLGASADDSGRAVFAVATADGALVQVHVQEGVDGLAPPGTFAPLSGSRRRTVRAPDTPTRVGMVFNWVPDRFLYVSDPRDNAIVKLHLDDDFQIFHVVDTRRLESPYLSTPIDLAPAVPEVANPGFSSNTTLAGGADLYVANRGSGTVVRLRQDGRVAAVAHIFVPGLGTVGPGMLGGIATSPDAQSIWVSLSSHEPRHPGLDGAIVRIPAFGAPS